MTFLSIYDGCFKVLFNYHIFLVYKKCTQASTGRPGRPRKMTGRQARLRKKYDRHRQAEGVYSLS
jgi:hypothetical protein